MNENKSMPFRANIQKRETEEFYRKQRMIFISVNVSKIWLYRQKYELEVMLTFVLVNVKIKCEEILRKLMKN